MKKANKMRDKPNFLLAPVLRKTAKGGKNKQTTATARLSSNTRLICAGKMALSGFEDVATVAEGRRGPRLV